MCDIHAQCVCACVLLLDCLLCSHYAPNLSPVLCFFLLSVFFSTFKVGRSCLQQHMVFAFVLRHFVVLENIKMLVLQSVYFGCFCIFVIFMHMFFSHYLYIFYVACEAIKYNSASILVG